MPLDLEAELDRLYGVDFDEFVQQRTRLVRALREEGRRAEAGGVQELRKPSLPAWTVNQLARRRRKDVDLLLDASHRLATAQRALLVGGDQRAFETARRRERTAVARLRDAAETILAGRATPAMLERVTATLRAAAGSDETRPLLARGRLTSDVAPGGFELLAGAPAVAATPEKSRPRRAKSTKPDEASRRSRLRRDEIARARAALKQATEREAAAARRLRDAERAAKTLRERLAHAEEELGRLRAEQKAEAAAVEDCHARLDAARET